MQEKIKRTLPILEALIRGYESGDFTPFYTFLAEDCVWQSEWVEEPVEGREKVMAYYEKKAAITRNSRRSSMHYFLVEIPELEDLGILMASSYLEKEGGVLLTLDLNEEGMVTGIDLDMPELYDFSRYAG